MAENIVRCSLNLLSPRTRKAQRLALARVLFEIISNYGIYAQVPRESASELLVSSLKSLPLSPQNGSASRTSYQWSNATISKTLLLLSCSIATSISFHRSSVSFSIPSAPSGTELAFGRLSGWNLECELQLRHGMAQSRAESICNGVM